LPIREFRCQACGHKFETLILPGEDEAAITCPECGGSDIRRCMSVCAARSRDGSGVTRSLGSGCASCSAGSCSSCR